ncbi:hypothetical protein HAX54_040487, partial [Datura stramonium]|nr:hypothetical protein [Datura stramonium]
RERRRREVRGVPLPAAKQFHDVPLPVWERGSQRDARSVLPPFLTSCSLDNALTHSTLSLLSNVPCDEWIKVKKREKMEQKEGSEGESVIHRHKPAKRRPRAALK